MARNTKLETTLEHLKACTDSLYVHPYDTQLYHERAGIYQSLGYPDLCAANAYRGLLLTDEIQDESGEFHEPAVEAFEDRAGPRTFETLSEYVLSFYVFLATTLWECGCLKSCYDFADRGLASDASEKTKSILREVQSLVREEYCKKRLQEEPEWDESAFEPKELPDQGVARRELYPWNDFEPDRFSEESLAVLNRAMSEVAPKCEVRAVELPVLTTGHMNGTVPEKMTIKQLGIFATEDIPAGETALNERSLLAANNRLHEGLCDACSNNLPPLEADETAIACEDCDDTLFCSQRCHDLAISSYHPAICGTDVDTIGKDTNPKEAADALHLLLIGRAMAMTETQEKHPLDLDEVKYTWGDFLPPPELPSTSSDCSIQRKPGQKPIGSLPFTFNYSILYPLHILEKMDLNIYTTLSKYDPWILNTLSSKFRGTASSRIALRDFRPETCAVHPLWCLANHSCDPNVKWEWGWEDQLYCAADGGEGWLG